MEYDSCSWALEEAEHLTMNQMLSWKQFPIMNCDVIWHNTISAGVHGSILSLNGSGMYNIRLEQVLKIQVSWMND